MFHICPTKRKVFGSHGGLSLFKLCFILLHFLPKRKGKTKRKVFVPQESF